MTLNVDIVIIGAGMAGASLAWRLAQYTDVLVIEGESQPGVHSTGRSAAMFMASYGTTAVRALTRAGRAFYDAPPQGFTDVPLLVPRGCVYVGDASDEPALASAFTTLSATADDVRRVSQAEVLSMVPVMRPEAVAGGIFEQDAADIDVHALHQGFLRGMRRAGAVLKVDARLVAATRHRGQEPGSGQSRGLGQNMAQGQDQDQGRGQGQGQGQGDGQGRSRPRGPSRWTLTLSDGTLIDTRVVVDAAGAWADEVASLCGAVPVGLQPRRRSAFVFDGPTDVDFRKWPLVVGIREDWYFKPDAGMLLGSPSNADDSLPHDVMPEEIDIATGIHNIEQATTLRIIRPRRTWAGLRTFAPDGDLVIGWDDACEGFYWLAGQGGYGIQSAAGYSELAALQLLGTPMSEHLQSHGVDASAVGVERLRRNIRTG